jgi:hypothetical protein
MMAISSNRIFFIILFFALASQITVARASERFPRPVFNEQRRFIVSATQDATVLRDPEIPFNVAFFDRAIASCGLNPADAIIKLKTMLREGSALWSSLDLVFPESQRQLSERHVTLFIDDFTEFAGEHPDFSSYYIKIEDQPIVGIGCGTLFRSYWLPTLAHEFTHALSDGKKLESWFEEGIAQNIEAEIGGSQPEYTMKALKGFPSLLEARKPLPSKENYAISQLFVRYVRTMAGGWNTLRAMISPQSKCTDTDFLNLIACRGKIYLESSSLPRTSNIAMGPDKMTRQGLLRYFAVAMTLNGPGTEKYFIYNWSGLNLPLRPPLQVLQPGQFQAWTEEANNVSYNASLELYRVLVNDRDEFVILPRDQAFQKSSFEQAQLILRNLKKDFFLLINTRSNALKITE